MAKWILKAHGKVAEVAPSNETKVRKRAELDAYIMQEVGDSFTLPPETLGKPKYASNSP